MSESAIALKSAESPRTLWRMLWSRADRNPRFATACWNQSTPNNARTVHVDAWLSYSRSAPSCDRLASPNVFSCTYVTKGITDAIVTCAWFNGSKGVECGEGLRKAACPTGPWPCAESVAFPTSVQLTVHVTLLMSKIRNMSCMRRCSGSSIERKG